MKNSLGQHRHGQLCDHVPKGTKIVLKNGLEDEIQAIQPLASGFMYILKNKNGYFGREEFDLKDPV